MSVRPSACGEFVFTSESVSEGHPDKVCDLIADSILDAHLAGDRNARVACEVLCKGGDVVLAGEITSAATVDAASIARDVIRGIGYTGSGRALQRRQRVHPAADHPAGGGDRKRRPGSRRHPSGGWRSGAHVRICHG